MKTKYANTELKCGSTIPGDDMLALSEKQINDAIDAMLRNYFIGTDFYSTDSLMYAATSLTRYGTITNVSID